MAAAGKKKKKRSGGGSSSHGNSHGNYGVSSSQSAGRGGGGGGGGVGNGTTTTTNGVYGVYSQQQMISGLRKGGGGVQGAGMGVNGANGGDLNGYGSNGGERHMSIGSALESFANAGALPEVPSIIDVKVSLPDARTVVEIRLLSTDTIRDLRNALCDHVAFCHETAFSFRHERYEKFRRISDSKQRAAAAAAAAATATAPDNEAGRIREDDTSGNDTKSRAPVATVTRVPEHQEIAFLKPYRLEVLEDEYTHDSAATNVRRLIDLLACTISMGESFGEGHFFAHADEHHQNGSACADGNTLARARAGEDNRCDSHGGTMKLEDVGTATKDSSGGAAAAAAIGCKLSEEGLVAGLAEADEESEFGLWQPPRVGDFYKFFSMRTILDTMAQYRAPTPAAAHGNGHGSNGAAKHAEDREENCTDAYTHDTKEKNRDDECMHGGGAAKSTPLCSIQWLDEADHECLRKVDSKHGRKRNKAAAHDDDDDEEDDDDNDDDDDDDTTFFALNVVLYYHDRADDSTEIKGDGNQGKKNILDGDDGNTAQVGEGAHTLSILASRRGFRVAGRPESTKHSLLQLLRCESRTFREGYAMLLECFANRNAWGNIPVGIRNNTWLIPPGSIGEKPRMDGLVSVLPLPAEDQTWGGDDGGHFCADGHNRAWRTEFQRIASMQGTDAHGRIARDRRCFLLHQLYADAATVRGTNAIKEAIGTTIRTEDLTKRSEDHMDIVVRAHPAIASPVLKRKDTCRKKKSDAAAEPEVLPKSTTGSASTALSASAHELLRGITSDGNTCAQDVDALTSVTVHHAGFVASIRASGYERCDQTTDSGDEDAVHDMSISVSNEPYADADGAHALNIHSLRMLLPHASTTTKKDVGGQARDIFARVLDASVDALEGDTLKTEDDERSVMRWELGANWAMHILNLTLDSTEPLSSSLIGRGSAGNGGGGCGSGGGALKSDYGNENIDNGNSCEMDNANDDELRKEDGDGTKVSSSAMHPDLASRLTPSQRRQLMRVSLKQIENIEQERRDQLEELRRRHKQQQQQYPHHYQFHRQLQQQQREHQEAPMPTPLHKMSLDELMASARDYHDTIALPQLVTDFGSLELSPVDGKTLTDFLHPRGINMSSLGAIAGRAEKLLHVKMLCVQEMVMRALKAFFRGLMSAAVTESATCGDDDDITSSRNIDAAHLLQEVLVYALNVVFAKSTLSTAVPSDEETRAAAIHDNLNARLWRWICAYVSKRFRYALNPDDDEDNVRQCRRLVRPLSLLRNLCITLGINMRTRDYNFNLANARETTSPHVLEMQTASMVSTFARGDIVCLVPVVKHCNYTSSDARALFESSKIALDRGLLDPALSDAIIAVDTMKAVCGASNRNTAVAMALMAVVMYHTGDFVQAAAYQQRAMQVNEREHGLDHPDTIKSYGDLAVFYYRLQHTELALTYVHRALYLLHMSCGPSHPNTAATLINLAMMMEGLGNGNGALRYLHEALNTNISLLGANHLQTAASYHAIAVALSLLEPPAYALSVQHENTTLNILEAELGPDDVRTVDASAWLEYFETKQVEIQHAKQHNMKKMPENNIASKGHLHVDDLLKFINDQQSQQHVHVVAKLASESRNLDDVDEPKVRKPSRAKSKTATLDGREDGHDAKASPAEPAARRHDGNIEVIVFSNLTRDVDDVDVAEDDVVDEKASCDDEDNVPSSEAATTPVTNGVEFAGTHVDENDLHRHLNEIMDIHDDDGWQPIVNKSKDRKQQQQRRREQEEEHRRQQQKHQQKQKQQKQQHRGQKKSKRDGSMSPDDRNGGASKGTIPPKPMNGQQQNRGSASGANGARSPHDGRSSPTEMPLNRSKGNALTVHAEPESKLLEKVSMWCDDSSMSSGSTSDAVASVGDVNGHTSSSSSSQPAQDANGHDDMAHFHDDTRHRNEPVVLEDVLVVGEAAAHVAASSLRLLDASAPAFRPTTRDNDVGIADADRGSGDHGGASVNHLNASAAAFVPSPERRPPGARVHASKFFKEGHADFWKRGGLSAPLPGPRSKYKFADQYARPFHQQQQYPMNASAMAYPYAHPHVPGFVAQQFPHEFSYAHPHLPTGFVGDLHMRQRLDGDGTMNSAFMRKKNKKKKKKKKKKSKAANTAVEMHDDAVGECVSEGTDDTHMVTDVATAAAIECS